MTPIPTLRIAIAILYRPSEHTLLVTFRPKDAHAGGVWEFPGGKMDLHETPEDAAARELLEETGIHCNTFSLWYTHRHTYPERIVDLHLCLASEEALSPSTLPTSQYRWISPQDLLDLPMPAGNRAWLPRLVQKLT